MPENGTEYVDDFVQREKMAAAWERGEEVSVVSNDNENAPAKKNEKKSKKNIKNVIYNKEGVAKLKKRIVKLCVAAGAIVVIAKVGPTAFGKFVEYRNNHEYQRELDLARSDLKDYTQTEVDAFVQDGSNLDAMLEGPYANLYQEFERYERNVVLSQSIKAMNLQYDIVEETEMEIDYESITPEKIEELIDEYWSLKNTEASQTVGNQDYEKFQAICNALQNCSRSIDAYDASYLTQSMYGVVTASRVANGMNFDGTQMSNIHFDNGRLIFEYEGEEYRSEELDTETLEAVFNGTPVEQIRLIKAEMENTDALSAHQRLGIFK